jgi:hypothetical protein
LWPIGQKKNISWRSPFCFLFHSIWAKKQLLLLLEVHSIVD